MAVTADAVALRRMLHAAAAAAAPEDDFSGLVGVLLSSHTNDTDGDVLVATATDRYVMAQINTLVQGYFDEPVFLRAGDVERLVEFLRDLSAAHLSVEDEALTLAGTRHGGLSASVTLPLAKCAFPKTFADLLEGPYPSSDEPASFAPHVLRTIAKIARRLDGDGSTNHVHIGLSSQGKPMRAHIGAVARIVAMPSRLQEQPTPPPVFRPFAPAGEVPA